MEQNKHETDLSKIGAKVFGVMLKAYNYEMEKINEAIEEKLLPMLGELDGSFDSINKLVAIIYNVSEPRIKHLNMFAKDVLGMPSLIGNPFDFLQFQEKRKQTDDFVFPSEIDVD